MSPKEYLDNIRPYLSDTINDHQAQSEWKKQLTMQINFISSKDSEVTRTMHTKSHNVETIMGNERDEIIEKHFESLWRKYQEGLEESLRRGSNFVFDSVDLLYYHIQKASLSGKGGSYIDSPEWPKHKKPTINPKTNNNNCFQYALTVALNDQNIEEVLKEYLKLSHLSISIIGKK